MKSLVNGRSVTHGSKRPTHPDSTIKSADVDLIRDYLQFAIESIQDVITNEETLRDGNRSPILGTLKQYAREGKKLLERLEA